jgi:hypothetical protein
VAATDGVVISGTLKHSISIPAALRQPTRSARLFIVAIAAFLLFVTGVPRAVSRDDGKDSSTLYINQHFEARPLGTTATCMSFLNSLGKISCVPDQSSGSIRTRIFCSLLRVAIRRSYRPSARHRKASSIQASALQALQRVSSFPRTYRFGSTIV